MKYFVIILGVLVFSNSFSQKHGEEITKLQIVLLNSINDQERVLTLAAICHEFSFSNFDSANEYGSQALELARKIKFVSGEIKSLCVLGIASTRNGDLPKAIELQLKAIQMAQERNLEIDEAIGYYSLSKSYYFLGDYQGSINYGLEAKKLFLNNQDISTNGYAYFNPNKINGMSAYSETDLHIAEAYLFSNQLDSALVNLQRLHEETVDTGRLRPIDMFLGYALFLSGKTESGLAYLRQVLNLNINDKNNYGTAWSGSLLAECFNKLNQTDSAIYVAKQALSAAQLVGFKDRIFQTTRLLATLYEGIDLMESHNYLKLAMAVNEELFGQEKIFELQKTLAREQHQKLEAEKRQIAYENSIRFYSVVAGLLVLMVIALLLYRNNRQKQKANHVLGATLTNLKATQTQLIQSEKMASLGELTAGIAHEIQNPLNFVNNFSEVNDDLIKELKNEVLNGNLAEVNTLASDIEKNSAKISHHGKRADAIVKGMLQHSQRSSGIKEPTNINVILEEYYRLAYQSFITKEKLSTEIKLITDLDASLPLVNVIPQEIGMVLLNLYNNAIWACETKSKGDSESPLDLETYIPTVKLTTKNLGDKIEIRISDNGPGIPPNIIDKIFQPFFTTKPTGEGTGLGLSLSYDIVKAHGGTISVNSNYSEPGTITINNFDSPVGGPPGGEIKVEKATALQGKGTVFIIRIPIN